MSGPKIGPALTTALLKLDELVESRSWAPFAMVNGFNTFRFLKRRGWVEDANAAARAEDPENTVRSHPTRWRLTEEGRRVAESLK